VATEDADFDFSPPSDSRPYFFNMLKPGAVLRQRAVSGAGVVTGNLLATSTLLGLSGIALVLVLAIVLWPLVRLGKPDVPTPVFGASLALFGFNVTIPYKTAIIPYLNQLDRDAWTIGAVNTVVRTGAYSWKGYNTDACGFEQSLLRWMSQGRLPEKALLLGSGGASKAVAFVLHRLEVPYAVVSRDVTGDIRFGELTEEMIREHPLIINTTLLGMAPDTGTCPPIPYEGITADHWLYDLVYNPANTLFLTRGQQKGARIMNGLDMLHLQADHAWQIWKSYGKF
jgi:shikimate dehydrogenase